MSHRSRARKLARSFLLRNDYKGWFEALYAAAAGNARAIPWADMKPNPHLINWLNTRAVRGEGKHALVVGCGLGDNAEALAQRGFSVTAFDISPHAILWCQQRFPLSRVNYVAADLFESPREWDGAFALVVEIDTLQVIPPPLRSTAITAIARYVANDGLLLLIARGREKHEDIGHLPWPLAKAELQLFAPAGLEQLSFDEFLGDETPPVRRFRVLYRKARVS